MKEPIIARTWYRFGQAKEAARKALGSKAGSAFTFGTRFGVWWERAPKGHTSYKDSIRGSDLKPFVDRYGTDKELPSIEARTSPERAERFQAVAGTKSKSWATYLFNVEDFTGGLAP